MEAETLDYSEGETVEVGLTDTVRVLRDGLFNLAQCLVLVEFLYQVSQVLAW